MARENNSIIISAAIWKGSFSKDHYQQIQFVKTLIEAGFQGTCKDKLLNLPGEDYSVNCSDIEFILPKGYYFE